MHESEVYTALAAACVRVGAAASTGARGDRLVVAGADLTYRVRCTEVRQRLSGWRSASYDPPRYRVSVDASTAETSGRFAVPVSGGVFDWDAVASRLVELAGAVARSDAAQDHRRRNRDVVAETRAALDITDGSGPLRLYASEDAARPIKILVNLEVAAATPERAREVRDGLRALGLIN